MENTYLELLRSLAGARRDFFRRISTFRRNQEDVITRFLSSEHDYLDMMARVQNLRRDTTPVFLNFPINIPNNFLDAVPVIPTQAQITNELMPFEQGESQVACAICQDAISQGGCRLRGCGHSYHGTCIRTWFGASTNCPVCRRDIRGDQASQTSSGEQEMQSPARSQ